MGGAMAGSEIEREQAGHYALWLEMLLDVTRRIHVEAQPDAVLAQIVENLVAITHADRGVLMLRDDDGQMRNAISRDRAGNSLGEEGLEVCLGVIEQVAETGETLFVGDAAVSEEWGPQPSVLGLHLHTILCLPLKTQDGVEGVIYADSAAIGPRLSAEDVRFLEAFAAQAAAAVERVKLQQSQLDRARFQNQLRLAAEIQRTFLPSEFPDIDGIVGAVTSVPALDVGGDFYDVIRLPGGRVGIMVGDVSGKGIAGALFGARILSDVRYEALYHGDVGMTLTAVNRLVAKHATRGMFVTFCYVVVDPTTHRVHYGNAGHVPPVVRAANGDVTEWTDVGDIPLGIHGDVVYQSAVHHLEPGQTLLILTDGLLDAVASSGERYGRERALAVIQKGPGGPRQLLSALRWSVTAFTGRRRQADDLTLLAVALS